MADQATANASAKQPEAAQAAPPPAPPKKTRRQLNRELAQAARDRKRNQHYANLRNPPTDKDVWICEFCEYESIFGQPPSALIRRYELKDRRARKEAAERQRLLEKAKMKSRKNKKNSKPAAAKTSAPAQDRTTPQGDATGPAAAPAQDQGADGGEYYEDEDGDDGGQDNGRDKGTASAGKEGDGGGDGTEGHRPLRPPTASQSKPDSEASTAKP